MENKENENEIITNRENLEMMLEELKAKNQIEAIAAAQKELEKYLEKGDMSDTSTIDELMLQVEQIISETSYDKSRHGPTCYMTGPRDF